MEDRAYEYSEEFFSGMLPQARKRMDILVPRLNAKTARILELGCGCGVLASVVHEMTGSVIDGIEYSRTGISVAKKHGVRAVYADLNRRFPYKDNSFDLVYSDQVLEHILKTDHFFAESKRVLKKNGVMLVITPNLSFWFNRLIFVTGGYPLFLEVSEKNKTYGTGILKKIMVETGAMGHIRVFNTSALSDMIEGNGFRITNKIGLSQSWNMPFLPRLLYDAIDGFFSHFPSLARDIAIIARKE